MGVVACGQSPATPPDVINLVSSEDELQSDGEHTELGPADNESQSDGEQHTELGPAVIESQRDDEQHVELGSSSEQHAELRSAEDDLHSDKQQAEWSVYMLQNSSGRSTYIGATLNLKRRIRQHNQEIAGGAKATRGKGPWRFVATVNGFQTQKQALQFEWRAKKKPKAGGGKLVVCVGIRNRILNFMDVLCLDKWTKGAPLATGVPLVLKWHDKVAWDLAQDNGPALPCYIEMTRAEL